MILHTVSQNNELPFSVGVAGCQIYVCRATGAVR